MLLTLVAYLIGFLLLGLAVFGLLMFLSCLCTPPSRSRTSKRWHEYDE